MGGKTLQAAAAFVGLVLILPLLIVVVMLIAVFGSLDTAEAACASAAQDQSMFGYPTDSHKIDTEWTAPAPNFPGHMGYDFKVDEGSRVYASLDGKVVQAPGGEVRIRSENVEIRYQFMQTVSVMVGADVKRGDPIGTSGTGNEGAYGLNGPHLHWEMWVDKDSNNKWSQQKPDSNPFEVDTSDSGGGCTCQTGDLSGANAQQQAFNFLVTSGWSKEQAAGMVGNMITESQVEPLLLNDGTPTGTKTQPADAVGTGRAWGIVQWYPASKIIQKSRDAGVDDKTIGTLAYQLDFLNKQLHGDGPVPLPDVGAKMKAATSVDDAAYAFGRYFEVFSTDPNDPGYTGRKANAHHVYDTFAGSAPAAGSGDSGGGCGAGSGNIAQVAKNLAWPQGPHEHWSVEASAAKPEYVAAMEKYNDGPNGETPYSDCGRFVATVLHMSGADPKFPNVYTPTQRQYMLDHPEIYDHWESTPPGGMKPGDILNGPGHTYLYVGPWGDGNGWNSAAGSLGQHVPTADNLYDVGPSGFWVFRVKGGTTPTTTAN
ncbi:phage tail tip lysozyme [Kribbella sp. NBC_00709]|uniref:phage tail tip lysozyme n=1 Tax=Kribbella sp. NBC_00709 TaxID=2975972 RepID=UPI002E2BAB9C|nr:phage tail tip lysozyme [Kribbella sp. NBC_00709]